MYYLKQHDLNMCVILRSGRDWEMQHLQTLQLHHPAEGETTEGDRGAVGDRRGFSLPDIPPGGAQAPPPTL